MRFSEGPRTTPDGATLWLRAWEPDERPPRAAGVLVHGLGEHCGRYAHVGERFARASLALLAFDLRGHGRSSGRRGDTRFEAALEDVDRRLADARATGGPAFLYGHSLGALLVLAYLVRRRPPVLAAIVSAPPLQNALREQRTKRLLSRTLGRILPGLTLSTGLDPAGLSRDPTVVEAYRRDPLVHDRATLGLAEDALAATAALEAGAATGVPLLVVHGGADPIAYPEGSRRLAARIAGGATLVVHEGLRHEPHNEPERERVLDGIVDWLAARLPPRDPAAGIGV
jgi:alpha-beta hydrolase superfamily lysophospholipase